MLSSMIAKYLNTEYKYISIVESQVRCYMNIKVTYTM